MPCWSVIERRYMRPFSTSCGVFASSAWIGGADVASGKLTSPTGIRAPGSGSTGHAAEDAGGGMAGAADGSFAMQRPAFGVTAAVLRVTTGSVVALASGVGSGGVRLQATRTNP